MSKDQWVRVRDEAELRRCASVKVIPCAYCKREEVVIITGPVPADGRRCRSGHASASFSIAGDCAGHDAVCFCAALREKRLFRLADHVFESETTSTRARETVGAGRDR